MAQPDNRERLVVLLPEPLKREIETRAAANRRTITGEVQLMLERAMKLPEAQHA